MKLNWSIKTLLQGTVAVTFLVASVPAKAQSQDDLKSCLGGLRAVHKAIKSKYTLKNKDFIDDFSLFITDIFDNSRELDWKSAYFSNLEAPLSYLIYCKNNFKMNNAYYIILQSLSNGTMTKESLVDDISTCNAGTGIAIDTYKTLDASKKRLLYNAYVKASGGVVSSILTLFPNQFTEEMYKSRSVEKYKDPNNRGKLDELLARCNAIGVPFQGFVERVMKGLPPE